MEFIPLYGGAPSRYPLMPFPDTSIEQWEEFSGLVDDQDQVQTWYGTLAVRSSGKLIISDTGLQTEDGALMDDMSQKGIDRDEVDMVVFTHLHPDHVGWNLTDGCPNFPNARYVIPQKDWDYWTKPEVITEFEYITKQVLPL